MCDFVGNGDTSLLDDADRRQVQLRTGLPKQGKEFGEQRDGVAFDGEGGETVGDHDRQVRCVARMLLQALAAGIVEFASEIRALQIGLAVFGGGVEQDGDGFAV